MIEAGKINCHNEWDPLKEIIVGTAKGTVGTMVWNRPGPIPQETLSEARKIAEQARPKWFFEEVEEDLDTLADTLRKLRVKVHRPQPFDFGQMYSTPFWTSNSNNIYNVRDLNLVVGNMVIESPSYLASRYYETTALYPIWYEYLEKGFRWIAGPKPVLNYEAKLPYFRDEDARELTSEDIKHKELTKGRIERLHKLAEKEILFEAANTARMGRDLLYLVSSSGNRLGAKWLQGVVGDDYRIHETTEIYRSSHIDSTVMCLRPGMVMLNSARVTKQNTPALFDKWDKIYFEKVAPTSDPELEFQRDVRDPCAAALEKLGFQTSLRDMSSPWVGMNFLSVDHQTVVVDQRQTALIKKLEELKFTVVPIRMRHIYTQGGGIHCATLDTVRNSKLESYFD